MRHGVLALGLLAACSSQSKKNTEPVTSQDVTGQAPAQPVTAPAIVPDAAPLAPASPIPAKATQLIVSVSDGWTGTDATLHRFQRTPGADWQAVGESVASTLGHTGLGWGRGLHEASASAGGEPVKHEGDGRSPAGVFHIGHSYGYEPSPAGTTLPFVQVSQSWRCVNDAESAHYNRVLDAKTTEKDWTEAERMRRRDALYELVIEVDHNHIVATETMPTPGDGSCIFLHVWRRPGAPTIGCTAMPLEAMQELLGWLRPDAFPVLVALPQERYQGLRQAWGLPDVSRPGPDSAEPR